MHRGAAALVLQPGLPEAAASSGGTTPAPTDGIVRASPWKALTDANSSEIIIKPFVSVPRELLQRSQQRLDSLQELDESSGQVLSGTNHSLLVRADAVWTRWEGTQTLLILTM